MTGQLGEVRNGGGSRACHLQPGAGELPAAFSHCSLSNVYGKSCYAFLAWERWLGTKLGCRKKINQEILSNKSQGKGCGTELSLAVPQTATTVFSQPTARPEEIQSRFKAELKPAANKALHLHSLHTQPDALLSRRKKNAVSCGSGDFRNTLCLLEKGSHKS